MKPKCPLCKKNNKVAHHSGNLFRCGRCGGLFDTQPNEGGDCYSDPTKRLRVQEQGSRDRSHLRGGL